MKSWCIPKPSARFVAKMEDALAVYHQPYDPQRPQVCLDEIHKTLRSTPRGQLPATPGQPQREDYEYARHGQCAIFLAVEPLAGRRYTWVHERRTKLDCALVLRDLVDVIYPDAEVIVLVVDNLNIHHPAVCMSAFHQPKHGASLNGPSGITHRNTAVG